MYLSKDYKVQNTSDVNTLFEIPEWADSLTYRNDNDVYLFWEGKEKCLNPNDKNDYLGKVVFSLYSYIREFDAKIVWRRGTLVEYLNPADWSLHVVDVDNDAAGEDWIKVPEGAIKLLYSSMNNNHYHFVNNLGQLMALYDIKNNNEYWYGDAYSYEAIASVVWQRYKQPEELPFVDDEPKNAWDKQEGGSHYKDLKIQPMQYALDNKLDYAQANVVKYVTRHANKNGKEDLLKAIHNIELMIEYYYGDNGQSQ